MPKFDKCSKCSEPFEEDEPLFLVYPGVFRKGNPSVEATSIPGCKVYCEDCSVASGLNFGCN